MFKEKLAQKALYIEKLIDKYSYKVEYPSVIHESMRYSINAGGKRIRPILLMETAKMFDAENTDYERLSVAIEMIHTYSLIHDDLPAMDDDELRRGKPTNHIVYGENMAILAGDGLLNNAYELMLSGYAEAKNKDEYIKAVSEIAKAAGVLGMVGGQVADILSETNEVSAEVLDYIHNHKTGALLCASINAGAILSQCSEMELDCVSRYATAIGRMFQIVDDILDVVGDEKTLGKKVGVDSEHNKLTYPHFYGLEQSYAEVDRLYDEAINAINPIGEKAKFLNELAIFLKERKN